MNCPACKSNMEPVRIRTIELDQCQQCRGVWLDHREIDELFAIPKIPERFLNQERYREPPLMVAEGERVCPRCGKDLRVIEVDGIVLDACGACKGFFADLGELRQLADAAERRFRTKQDIPSE
jgi:Zn-finger nucleic acid-binding protein